MPEDPKFYAGLASNIVRRDAAEMLCSMGGTSH
jgi:hypothetical protein